MGRRVGQRESSCADVNGRTWGYGRPCSRPVLPQPFTFDDAAFARAVESLCESREEGVGSPDLAFPSFDHAVGDPIEGGAEIPSSVSVVIVEGNYVIHWPAVRALLDEAWQLSTPRSLCLDRVASRPLPHLAGRPRSDYVARAESNDGPNWDTVYMSQGDADVVLGGGWLGA